MEESKHEHIVETAGFEIQLSGIHYAKRAAIVTLGVADVSLVDVDSEVAVVWEEIGKRAGTARDIEDLSIRSNRELLANHATDGFEVPL
jgi:hypothetical protein